MATININKKDYEAGSLEATNALKDWGKTLGVGAPAPVAPATPTGITAPKPVEAPPMNSLTTTGKNYLSARTQANQPSDELTVKKLYRDRGFGDTYGEWRGTDAQYKAMWMQDIQEGINQVNQRIATEGITDNQGKVLQAPTQPVPPGNTPSGTADGDTMSSSPTEEFVQSSQDDFKLMTDEILKGVGTTDLSKLIQEFSGGDLTTPEFELSKEEKDVQLEDLKNAAAQGLQNIQKSLAQRGMTFSGIRTESEANFAAEVLSKESGINRQFAARIIGAARQEQGRRETALKAAETNYNKALEAQGYIYNPITNTIEKTLQRSKMEFDAALDVSDRANPKPESAPTSYKEWELAGGKEGTGKSYAQWLAQSSAKAPLYTEKDFYGAVNKGVTDLQQGEDWGNVWNRVKQQFPNVSNDIIDNALGISWREPEAYQKWAEKKKGGTESTLDKLIKLQEEAIKNQKK